MTDDLLIEINSTVKDIRHYNSYLLDRFQLNNKQYDVRNITDDWILNIVPIEVFKLKQEFFYIGKAYGFYLKYDNNNHTYLIYLLRNRIEYSEGILTRDIQPIYYEQYVFNEESDTVSLLYMDYYVYPDPENMPTYRTHYYHYKKLSDYEKLYLKDVNFTGSLYNENHLNIDEENYDPYKDNGGYFVESRYLFKGVSTQYGKFDFADAVLQIGLGYIPLGTSGLSVGDLLNVGATINELVKFANNAVNDFRGTVSNEGLYKNTNFFGMERNKQILELGRPLKCSATKFYTNNTKEAVLLGINKNCNARNEWLINYFDQADMWNTRFVGDISLDIVKETDTLGGSKVVEIAKNITPITPCTFTIDNGEETLVNENEEEQLYILNDAKHTVSFTAPENGNYTIKTFGNVKNNLISKNPEYGEATPIDSGTNNKMTVKLKKGEAIKLYVTKVTYAGSEFIGLEVKFTPEEITKGESKQLQIAPNEKEFFEYNSQEGMGAFDFSIESPQLISLDILQSTLSNSKYYISGKNIVGSMITNNEMYFIGIVNNTDEIITVTVKIDAVKEIKPKCSTELSVLDKKIIILSSPFNAGVSINAVSQASINMELYDENNELINLTQSSDESVIKQTIEKDKKYYLLLENYSYIMSNVNVSVNWDAKKLAFGNNTLQKVDIDDMFEYEHKAMDAQFTVLSNCSFIIYDSNFNVFEKDAEGYYSFLNQEVYYLISQSRNDDCTIDIALNYTENTSGIFSVNGTGYIKYVPNRTSVYKVEGITDYKWFSEEGLSSGAYLYANNTYYVRIEGAPSQQYNVRIVMNRNQVPIGRVTNLYSGYYYFNIEVAGVYSLRTYCSNNVSSTISIYNEDRNAIENGGQLCENLNVDITAVNVYLDKGLYYVDLNGSSDTVRIGVQINKK